MIQEDLVILYQAKNCEYLAYVANLLPLRDLIPDMLFDIQIVQTHSLRPNRTVKT